MNKPQARVLIMAGGTGGHIFPALATAEKLMEQGLEVQWLGSRNGLEEEIVAKAGIHIHLISVSGLRGKGKLSLVLAPFKLAKALLQAFAVVRKAKPDAVLGMGGFASGPGGLAARMLSKPLIIHEQNAIAGLTNKALAKFATGVFEAFGSAFSPKVHTQVIGNPIRGDILNLPRPEQRFANRSGKIRLLVVGGSLGAQAINEVLPEVLADIDPALRPEVWHQTGKRNFSQTQEKYAEYGINDCLLSPFIAAMDEAYGWADLVLCRAGALTVSEISIAGVASIMVPYPYAVDDHQTKNARFLADAGAAILIQQNELSKQRLHALLTEQLAERTPLLKMANIASSLGRPEASTELANVCIEAIKA